MQEHGAFLIDKDEDIATLRALVFPDGGTKLNRAVVGKFPYQVGEMCGLNIPETAKIMLVKNQAWGEAEVLCRALLQRDAAYHHHRLRHLGRQLCLRKPDLPPPAEQDQSYPGNLWHPALVLHRLG